LVSSQVNRTIRANYTSIGAIRLKNIRYPVPTYRVSVHTGKAYRPPHIVRAAAEEFRDYRPSIAILPFNNLSDDTASDYFPTGSSRTSSFH